MIKLISGLQKKIQEKSNNWCFDRILETVPSLELDNSDILFLFSSSGIKDYDQIYLLFAHALAQRGIASCFLFKSDSISARFPNLVIGDKRISNSMVPRMGRISITTTNETEEPLQFEWDVDLDNENAIAEGVNFFPLIRSNLRSYHKRYNIDFKNPSNMDFVPKLIKTCDLLLGHFLALKEYAQKRGVKIRIVGREPYYISDGLFKILCDKFSRDRDIEYIDLGRGYIHYFGLNMYETYLAISNMTKTESNYRVGITLEEFGEFSKNGIDDGKITATIDGVLSKQEQGTPSEEKEQIERRITQCRSRGKKVFVLLAHVFYDTPENDMSRSFNDMCDWIRETITFFRKSESLLLLKPHPTEIFPEHPYREPNETLASFVNDMISDCPNILLLDPRLFSLREISAHMSCGLIWRSSAAMELTYLKVPCIIAGNPPYKCLPLIYAENKMHYFNLIDNSDELKVTGEQIMEVARYIFFFEKFKHYHLDYFPVNSETHINNWDKRSVKRYLRKGDEIINEIINKMLD